MNFKKRDSISFIGYVLLIAAVITCDVYFLWLAPKSQIVPVGKIYIGGLIALLLVLVLELVFGRNRKDQNAQQPLVKERLVRSVKQLQDENPKVRQVGVHRLQKLRKEANVDDLQITQTLSACIRDASPLAENVIHQSQDNHGEEVSDQSSKGSIKAPVDIQAILDLIEQFGRKNNSGFRGRVLDLSKTNLQKVNLFDSNLEHADLSESNLEEANLWSANLKNVNLRKANLKGANLFEAHLKNANFFGANLEGSKLWEANLDGADLREANMNGADLRGAKLEKAILPEGNLNNTKYDDNTTFPEWFDQKKRDALGMVMEIE